TGLFVWILRRNPPLTQVFGTTLNVPSIEPSRTRCLPVTFVTVKGSHAASCAGNAGIPLPLKWARYEYVVVTAGFSVTAVDSAAPLVTGWVSGFGMTDTRLGPFGLPTVPELQVPLL